VLIFLISALDGGEWSAKFIRHIGNNCHMGTASFPSRLSSSKLSCLWAQTIVKLAEGMKLTAPLIPDHDILWT